MNDTTPVTLGIAGIAGYAKAVADMVRQHGPASDPPVRLAAVGDPAVGEPAHAERVAELAGEGVTVYPGLEPMLAEADIEAVWLPVPIALHEPFTLKSLQAKKAVMAEKPAAGSVDEVDAMIAARDRAGLPVLVGFQAIYSPATAEAKRRLLDGAIGRVKRASVHGYWPRSDHYFARTNWAGRVRQGERWVLDSPVQNAMSHYLNLALFLLGPAFERSAAPARIEAELYRAAAIENYDTISARLWIEDDAADDVPLLVLLTHASPGQQGGPWIRIEGESGVLTWSARGGGVLETAAGQREELPSGHGDGRPNTVQAFARTVRDRSVAPNALATLEVARAHLVAVNGASQAAPIVPVPEDVIERVTGEQGEVFCTIPGITATFDRCAAEGKMLHESGHYAFTRPPGECDLRGYAHFAGPAGEAEATAAT